MPLLFYRQRNSHKYLSPISPSGPSSAGDHLLKLSSVWALLFPSLNLPSPLSQHRVVTSQCCGAQRSSGVFLCPCQLSLKKCDAMVWELSVQDAMQSWQRGKRLCQRSWEDASSITGGYGSLASQGGWVLNHFQKSDRRGLFLG